MRLRLVVLRLVGKCRAWNQSLCRAAGCGYLLLCSAEREEPKTSWKGANLLFPLFLCPCITLPTPSNFHPALHLCPNIPRAWLKSGVGWGAADQLQASAGTCLGSFLQACPASDQKYYPILLSHLFLDSECWHQLQTQKKALNDKIFCIIRLFVQLTRIYFQSLSQQCLFCLRLACHFFCLVSVLLITLL